MHAAHQSIRDVLAALSALPYAGRLQVFGSCARGTAAPADVDVFLDLRGSAMPEHGYRTLLAVGRQHYGCLDPFLRTDQGLFVRDPDSITWIRASNSPGLEADMDRLSVPLEAVLQRLAECPPRRFPSLTG